MTGMHLSPLEEARGYPVSVLLPPTQAWSFPPSDSLGEEGWAKTAIVSRWSQALFFWRS